MTMERRPGHQAAGAQHGERTPDGLRRRGDETGEVVLAETGADRCSALDGVTVTVGLVDQGASDTVEHVVAGGVGMAGRGLAQPGRQLAQQAEADGRVALDEP